MRTAPIAIATASLAAAALLTGCGPDSSAIVTTAAAPAPLAVASAPAPAHIGDAITLSGLDAGSKAQITLLRVITTATPSNDFNAPAPGKRLVAAQFRIADVGTAAYSDAPSNGAKVVDAQGQSFGATIAGDISEGPAFSAETNIAPGDSGLGYVVFEVPAESVITKVQFAMDSGFGDQTAQWTIN